VPVAACCRNQARRPRCNNHLARRNLMRMAGFHMRRDKAALFQRVQAPPGDRSSRKQPEQAWRGRNV
jgi:hypothetical protein